MTKEEFMKKLEEDEEFSPGWQAIDDAFDEVYPDASPEHFGTLLPSRAMFGGEEYLDGYSVYQSPKGYKHIVTYGMTEFIQLVGLTTSEVEAVIADPDNNIPKLIQMMTDDGNPDLVTDMKREKSYM